MQKIRAGWCGALRAGGDHQVLRRGSEVAIVECGFRTLVQKGTCSPAGTVIILKFAGGQHGR